MPSIAFSYRYWYVFYYLFSYYKFLFLFYLFISGTLGQTPVTPASDDANCDRILNSMISGCKQIRSQLLTQKVGQTADPAICCALFRYRMAVQSVRAYATIAKATRICAERAYDEPLNELETASVLAPYRDSCAAFNSQSCITEPAQAAWNSAVNTVQNTYSQLNVDQLGQQIGSNWNNAMSSLSNWANNFGGANGAGNSIVNGFGSIGSRLQEGATALQGQLTARTQQVADAVSGQGANRYSLVGDSNSANKGDSLSLDSIIHSVVPDVEIVESKPGSNGPVKATENAGGKRFSLTDWFGSMTQSMGLSGASGSSVAVSDDSEQNEEQVARRRNPYSATA